MLARLLGINPLQLRRRGTSNRAAPSEERDSMRVEVRTSSQKLVDNVEMCDINTIDHDENCVICLEPLWPKEYMDDLTSQPKGAKHLPVSPRVCEHQFHLDCMRTWFANNASCPMCRKQMIVITGYQPHTPQNRMKVERESSSLPGYRCGTTVITFHIGAGVQQENHPIPGRRFNQYTFKTYLPRNSEGEELVDMLRLAWNRGLLFRIGYNSHTKKFDTIVLNGIELKSNKYGGPLANGFPDPNYLSGLKTDLHEIGIRI